MEVEVVLENKRKITMPDQLVELEVESSISLPILLRYQEPMVFPPMEEPEVILQMVIQEVPEVELEELLNW